MNEECPYCGATFKVIESAGGGFCGACREPINCPNCLKTVREERTTGVFHEELIKAPDSPLARHLGITDSEWEEIGADLQADTGSSGETNYSYWFTVPNDISEDILEKTGWETGQTIDDIPTWVVDSN